MFFNRLIPYFSFFLFFAGFEAMITKQQWYYYIMAFFVLWVFLVVWRLLGFNEIKKIGQWNFLVPPLFLIFFAGAVMVFLEDSLYQQVLLLVSALLASLFLETIFVYIYEHENYQEGALENISLLGNLISTFFLLATGLGLKIFIGLPVWLEFLIVLPLIAILINEIIWVNKIVAKDGRIFVATLTLLLGELLLAVNFLPINFYVSSFVLLAIFYVLISLSLDYLKKQIVRLAVVKYLAISLTTVAVALLTAQWL